MALTSTSKQIASLKINKVPSKTVYNRMVSENKINDDELYLVQDEEQSIDTSNFILKDSTNIMGTSGKITMSSSYTPSSNQDVATKKYVDDAKPSVIGTNTAYGIYIGSTQPASGTAPLLWIDTTASTGVLKYRTSTTGTWTPVPVAWG